MREILEFNMLGSALGPLGVALQPCDDPSAIEVGGHAQPVIAIMNLQQKARAARFDKAPVFPDPMPMTADDDDALKARRDKLAAELQARQPKPQAPAPLSPQSTGAASAWSLGMKAGSEFVAAVCVGGAIGWGIDYLAHTKPAFTIVFFLLGVASGTWNVIRATTPKGGA